MDNIKLRQICFYFACMMPAAKLLIYPATLAYDAKNDLLLAAGLNFAAQVLVLGDTAVKAGLVSSPAIIIVALSGISAYTVPDLAGTVSVVRIVYILVAGSLGPYGILLLTALLLYYLIGSDGYGVPLLAPFAPLIRRDLRDALYKANIRDLDKRPAVLGSRNQTRLRTRKNKENAHG